jgi:uncharacterized membrane protein
MTAMRDLALFLHLAAAIFWMGGMAFMVLALRPALGLIDPPQRVRVVAAAMKRFFAVVAISIAALLVTGGWMFAQVQPAPRGFQVMAALGVAMMLVFGYIVFAPYRRLKQAAAREDWPAAGHAAARITLLAKVNLGLGWVAIAAVLLWH